MLRIFRVLASRRFKSFRTRDSGLCGPRDKKVTCSRFTVPDGFFLAHNFLGTSYRGIWLNEVKYTATSNNVVARLVSIWVNRRVADSRRRKLNNCSSSARDVVV